MPFIEIAHAAAEVARETVGEVVTEAESTGALGALGINLKLFIAQLVNFAIVLFVLWKWAWKPIMKVLDDRAKRVEQSVHDAKRIAEELKLLDKNRGDLMREAEAKAQGVLKEAQGAAAAHRTEELERAHAAVGQMIEKGKQELAAEKERMVRSAKAEVAELVVAATEKMLVEKLDAKRDRALVERVLEKIS